MLREGKIRLGCLFCRRTDCDGIDELPVDWTDIDEVPSYAEFVKPADPDDGITFWETHLGICPDCQKHGQDMFQSPLDDLNTMNQQ